MLNCLVELCIRRVVFSLVLLLYCVVYITDFYRVAVNKVAKNTRVSPERRELPRSVRLGVGWIMGGVELGERDGAGAQCGSRGGAENAGVDNSGVGSGDGKRRNYNAGKLPEEKTIRY